MPEYISPRPQAAAGTSAAGAATSALPQDGLVAAASVPARGKTVLIDNYDSFTYNVVEVSARGAVQRCRPPDAATPRSSSPISAPTSSCSATTR